MTGVELIGAERERQIRVECFTESHDDQHVDAELSRAGTAYAIAAGMQVRLGPPQVTAHDMRFGVGDFPSDWYAQGWWKPSNDPVRNLVKAGALIAAEIDRILRERRREEERTQAQDAAAEQAARAARSQEGSTGHQETVTDAPGA